MPDDEIVKAFEVEKGEFVLLEDEDFEAVKREGVKSIDISDFVPYERDRPDLLRAHLLPRAAEPGGEKVYALLRKAHGADRARRDREVRHARPPAPRLPARPRRRDHARALYFHDEIRPVDEIAPEGVKVAKGELEMATALIEQFTGEVRAREVRGHVPRRAAARSSARSARARRSRAPEPETEEEPTDLLAALRASVEAAKRSGRPARAKRAPARQPEEQALGAALSSDGPRRSATITAWSTTAERERTLELIRADLPRRSPRRASDSATAPRPSSSAASGRSSWC